MQYLPLLILHRTLISLQKVPQNLSLFEHPGMPVWGIWEINEKIINMESSLSSCWGSADKCQSAYVILLVADGLVPYRHQVSCIQQVHSAVTIIISHGSPQAASISIPREQGSWGQHGAHLGPVSPRWAPYWPREPCYQGLQPSSIIFKLITQNSSLGVACEIAFRWMLQDTFDDNLTFVQVLAWCCQATSHYPSQFWLKLSIHMTSPGHNELNKLVLTNFGEWCEVIYPWFLY